MRKAGATIPRLKSDCKLNLMPGLRIKPLLGKRPKSPCPEASPTIVLKVRKNAEFCSIIFQISRQPYSAEPLRALRGGSRSRLDRFAGPGPQHLPLFALPNFRDS